MPNTQFVAYDATIAQYPNAQHPHWRAQDKAQKYSIIDPSTSLPFPHIGYCSLGQAVSQNLQLNSLAREGELNLTTPFAMTL